MRLRSTAPVPLAWLALLAAGCSSGWGASSSSSGLPLGGVPSSSGSGYHPVIDPSDFSAKVDNPWFPLTPGSRYTYMGVKDGEPLREAFVVSHDTKVIDGVTCVVVDDQVFLSGKLEERITDYYTQDTHGNVWYFGEATEELDENGHVTSREGSWKAGQNGAEPGIYIQANPVPGQGSRQEFYAGQAEDQFSVVSLSTPITVPYGTFTDALLTEEWTVLEPTVLDHKYYVKGVGEVAELSVKGPTERARLVSVTRLSG